MSEDAADFFRLELADSEAGLYDVTLGNSGLDAVLNMIGCDFEAEDVLTGEPLLFAAVTVDGSPVQLQLD